MDDVPAVPPPAEAMIEERTVARSKVLSRELLGDRGELIIVHAGREYRLRLTQNGKLILTA